MAALVKDDRRNGCKYEMDGGSSTRQQWKRDRRDVMKGRNRKGVSRDHDNFELFTDKPRPTARGLVESACCLTSAAASKSTWIDV